PGLDLRRRALLGDVFPGLFPGGGAEGVLAALAAFDADQRRLDAIGVVGLAQARLAAGADLAAVEGRIGIAVELDDALVGALAAGGDADVAQGRAEVADAIAVFFELRLGRRLSRTE